MKEGPCDNLKKLETPGHRSEAQDTVESALVFLSFGAVRISRSCVSCVLSPRWIGSSQTMTLPWAHELLISSHCGWNAQRGNRDTDVTNQGVQRCSGLSDDPCLWGDKNTAPEPHTPLPGSSGSPQQLAHKLVPQPRLMSPSFMWLRRKGSELFFPHPDFQAPWGLQRRWMWIFTELLGSWKGGFRDPEAGPFAYIGLANTLC